MRILALVFHFSILSIVFSATSCSTNKQQENNKVVIELIASSFNKERIVSIASNLGATDTQLYQWNKHLVLYTQLDQLESFSKQINQEFPGVGLKFYDRPFYYFSNIKRCTQTTFASEWKHFLLTANLVDDNMLQQEYLEYHRIQFEEWPEIAEGFCHAGFQELLLYRNGRQLMLVISIPANKTLDELNPKTYENNPRMDEWNRIMGKYQEGIEGSKPGEKWVFLNKVEYK